MRSLNMKCEKWNKLDKSRRSSYSPVQFSRLVVSNSLRPHELQHTRPPCPSPTPGVYSDSFLLSLWWDIQPSHSRLPPSIFLSIRVFSNESVLCIRWPKYWLQFKGWQRVRHDLATKHSYLPDKLATIVFLTI